MSLQVKNGEYESLPTDCDVSATSLQWAAENVGASFVYDLRVGPRMTMWVRSLLVGISAIHKDNPLSPYINLVIDGKYGRDEWSLHANGRGCGSPGVPI